VVLGERCVYRVEDKQECGGGEEKEEDAEEELKLTHKKGLLC